MLVPLVFLLLGFALGLAATGNAGGLVLVESFWLAVSLSVGSAYLIFLAGRGMWRHWQTEPVKPSPTSGQHLALHALLVSSLGTGLLLLALFGESVTGTIRFVSPGAAITGGAGVLLDLFGLGLFIAGRQVGAAGRAVKVARTGFVVGIPGVGLAVVLVAMIAGPMGNCLTSCMGYGEPVLELLNACPKATVLLGEPINAASFGWSCGNAEENGAFGQASWTMPVEGPLGRGSVSFNAEKRGGPWKVLAGELEVGEQRLDFVSCQSTRTVSLASVDSYQGQVTSVIGGVPVVVGAPCIVLVGPGGKEGVCRVQVSCAGAMLYGGGTTGYLTCDVEDPVEGGAPVLSLQDRSPSADGGDPMLDLRFTTGRVIVSDHGAGGLWAVHIELRGKN